MDFNKRKDLVFIILAGRGIKSQLTAILTMNAHSHPPALLVVVSVSCGL